MEAADTGTLNTGSLSGLALGGLMGARNLSTPAALTVGGNGAATTYSGNLSGAAALTVVGPGSLYLSGAESLATATINSLGVLEVATTAALPTFSTSGAISVAGGGSLIVQTGNGTTGWTSSQIGTLLASGSWASGAVLGIDTSNLSLTYTGNITTGLTKLGANPLTLTGSIAASGPLTVGAGAVNILAANPTVGGLAGAGNLVLANTTATTTLTVNSNVNSTFSGVISAPASVASLVKTGPNMLTLTGSNAYTGGTTVSQGVLAAGVSNIGSGPLNLAGGTFQPAATLVPGLTANYYYTFAPLSQANNLAQPNGWNHLGQNVPNGYNGASLNYFLNSYLVSNGPNPWAQVMPSNITTGNVLNGVDNITQDVVNGANGVFNFDTSGEGQNFPYPYNQATSVYWAAKYTGFFYAPTTGTYTFATNSDDDSRLWINAGQANPDTAIVVNGNGGQGWAGAGIVQNVTGTVNLTGGQYYPITIGFEEGNGGYGLEAFYAPPGSTLTVGQTGTFLPVSLLFTGNPVVSYSNALTVTQNSTINLPTSYTFSYQFPSLSISSGTLSTSGGVAGAGVTISGTTTLTGSATFNPGSNAPLTLAGAVGGNGSLIETGSGLLILAASNTYHGTTTINGGTLQIGNGGNTGTLGAGALVNNGAVVFSRSDTLAITQVLSGSGAVGQNGPGLLTISSLNNYSGGTVVNGGTLTALNNAALGSGPLTVAAAGTVNFPTAGPSIGGLAGAGNVVLGNTATSTPTNLTLNVASGSSFFFSGAISDLSPSNAAAVGSLTKTGPGTQTLLGNNGYTGTTTVSQGVLAASVAKYRHRID